MRIGEVIADNHEEQPLVPSLLNEEQRAAAFASALAPSDRAAALDAHYSTVPPKFILWMVVAFLILGGGGVIVEHYFGNIGVAATTTTEFQLQTTPTIPRGTQLNSSLSAFMGLKQIGAAVAPAFTLRDQSGEQWSLNGAKGRVVVLTFYSKLCSDVCPVLGAEIKQAQILLKDQATRVEFVIVNSDPHHVTYSPTPRALSVPRLTTATSVHFLTGPLAQLNAVWSSYGLTVRVGVVANQVSHNNILYFIDARGHLRAQATPFGNEDRGGQFTLSAADIHHFAEGIARTASSLVK